MKNIIFDLDLTLVDTTCLEELRHNRNWAEAYKKIPHTSMYSGIKEILEMEQWNESKFQPLLTPNIWNSNFSEIKEILSMSEWSESKFQFLLTSSIWTSNSKEIKESIKDVPKESLEQDVNSFISKELTAEQQKALKKIDKNNNIKFKC